MSSPVLATVSLSLLNFALSFGVLFGVQENPLLVTVLWLPLVTLVLPVVLTFGYLWFRTGSFPTAGPQPVPPVPTAFDFIFGSRRGLIVRFTDEQGRLRAGYYGPDSHASPFPNTQQLYLERAVDLDEDGHPVGFREEPEGVILRVEDHHILEILPAVEGFASEDLVEENSEEGQHSQEGQEGGERRGEDNNG